MPKFRKKPIVIDAFHVIENNLRDLKSFVESFGDKYEDHFNFIDEGPDGASLSVKTLEGTSYDVKPGNFIIRGINGEYYPCQSDIFQKTYEPVD